MPTENTTLNHWYTVIQNRFQGVPREALRFYNIEALPRLMNKLQMMQAECIHCASRLKTLDDMTLDAGDWIKTDAPEVKSFQNELRQVLKHLSSKHAVYAKGLWLSRIVIIGFLLGTLVALAVHYLTGEYELAGLIMTGAATGLVAGWTTGKVREYYLRRRKQLF